MASKQRSIGAIQTGQRLLDAFVAIGRPAMLRELAQWANLTPAQAHAYLVSYRHVGLVEQDAQSGHYRLGPFALSLGLARLRTHDPLLMTSQAIVTLSRTQASMVSLSVWGSYGPTIIQVQEGPSQLHVNVKAGAVFSICGTATGRVFAAFLPDDLVAERVAAEMAEKGAQRIGAPSSMEVLRQHTKFVRECGYAPIDGQPIPGVNALAAPVRDYTGQVQCVVTMIGAAGMMDTRRGGERAEALLTFVARLSADLGYAPERGGHLQPGVK